MSTNEPLAILISLVDNKLRLSPKKKVTPELLQYIKANKQEIVQYIQDLKRKVASTTLKELSCRNIAIKVHSEILEEDIYFISREEMQNMVAGERLVSYLPQELEGLIKRKTTADEIKKNSHGKKGIPGEQDCLELIKGLTK